MTIPAGTTVRVNPEEKDATPRVAEAGWRLGDVYRPVVGTLWNDDVLGIRALGRGIGRTLLGERTTGRLEHGLDWALNHPVDAMAAGAEVLFPASGGFLRAGVAAADTVFAGAGSFFAGDTAPSLGDFYHDFVAGPAIGAPDFSLDAPPSLADVYADSSAWRTPSLLFSEEDRDDDAGSPSPAPERIESPSVPPADETLVLTHSRPAQAPFFMPDTAVSGEEIAPRSAARDADDPLPSLTAKADDGVGNKKGVAVSSPVKIEAKRTSSQATETQSVPIPPVPSPVVVKTVVRRPEPPSVEPRRPAHRVEEEQLSAENKFPVANDVGRQSRGASPSDGAVSLGKGPILLTGDLSSDVTPRGTDIVASQGPVRIAGLEVRPERSAPRPKSGDVPTSPTGPVRTNEPAAAGFAFVFGPVVGDEADEKRPRDGDYVTASAAETVSSPFPAPFTGSREAERFVPAALMQARRQTSDSARETEASRELNDVALVLRRRLETVSGTSGADAGNSGDGGHPDWSEFLRRACAESPDGRPARASSRPRRASMRNLPSPSPVTDTVIV